MVFQVQKISNYGTSTPAVARTVVQGSELIQVFPIGEEVKEKVKIVLFDLKRQLLRCVQIHDQIKAEVCKAKEEIAEKGLDFQSSGRAVTLPSVSDLQSQAESFLQSAKLALRDSASLLEPFFGESFDHRFHRIVSWAEQNLSVEDDLTQCLGHWEPWVKRIVTMRNAVDHPRDEPYGKLIVKNFKLLALRAGHVLQEPTWALLSEPPSQLLPDMATIIECIIRLAEDILVICLLKNRGKFPLYIYEIPEEERDRTCPIRLRVGIRQPKRQT